MGHTAAREQDIQRAILQLLTLRGIPAWRANTGAFTGEYKGQTRFVRFGTKGQADILGVLPPAGRLLALEVKRPGGKLTLEQDAFLRVITQAGGLAALVTSPAEVEALLRRHQPGRGEPPGAPGEIVSEEAWKRWMEDKPL
jgi:hypothetical protein